MFKSDLIALQYKLLRSKQALCKMNFFFQNLCIHTIFKKKKSSWQYRQCRWEAGEESMICDCTTVWFDTLQRHGVDTTLNGLSFLPGALLEILWISQKSVITLKKPFHVFSPVVKGIITTSSSTTEVPWEGGKMFKGINVIKKEKLDFITWRALKLGPNTKFS